MKHEQILAGIIEVLQELSVEFPIPVNVPIYIFNVCEICSWTQTLEFIINMVIRNVRK